MINIGFKIDKEALKDSLEDPLSEVDPVSLYLTYFIMPMRFNVDGKDVFSISGSNIGPWFDIALLNLAASCFERIRLLPIKKNVTHILPETWGNLRFSWLGDNKVLIDLDKNDEKFIVDYDELLSAFEKFSKKVKDFLCDCAPEIKEHTIWGPWIKGLIDVDELWNSF